MRVFPRIDVMTPFRRMALMALVLASGFADASPLSESVVRTSPLGEIIKQYPVMMSQGIRDGLKQTGQVDPLVADTIGSIVSRAFTSAGIRQQVVTDLEKGLSEDQLHTVQDWYETPLGSRVAKAEVAASRPAAWNEIESNGAALAEKYKGTERADMFSRFDQVSRATESTVDTAIAVQLGLASAMSAFQGGQGPSFEQMKEQIESQRFMLRGAVEQQVYAAYLYTYESFSTAEIDQYLDFLESKPGARFNTVVTNSIQTAILKPVETVGSQLVRLLNPAAAVNGNGQ